MRHVAILIMCLPLSGCFVGQFFGADYNVTVNNHTDRTIKAYPNGDLVGDDVYESEAQSIKHDDRAVILIDGFEADPSIRVEYHGVKRDFDVDYDWLGYDEITVETWHFVQGNG